MSIGGGRLAAKRKPAPSGCALFTWRYRDRNARMWGVCYDSIDAKEAGHWARQQVEGSAALAPIVVGRRAPKQRAAERPNMLAPPDRHLMVALGGSRDAL